MVWAKILFLSWCKPGADPLIFAWLPVVYDKALASTLRVILQARCVLQNSSFLKNQPPFVAAHSNSRGTSSVLHRIACVSLCCKGRLVQHCEAVRLPALQMSPAHSHPHAVLSVPLCQDDEKSSPRFLSSFFGSLLFSLLP